LIFGAMELFFGITGTQQGVAHFAHLGGMVTGYFLILKWRRDYERRIEAQRGFD
ncbi:MAG: rhomboid family intramembrane serine protease, partial [Xanthomonadales bacterium]|nr:rhomboid family intramembrane serine protease [Xanthomonadales bacterium]